MLLLLWSLISTASAAEDLPSEVGSVEADPLVSALSPEAVDTPGDDGSSVTVRWAVSRGMAPDLPVLILRRDHADSAFRVVGRARLDAGTYRDARGIRSGTGVQYRLGVDAGAGVQVGRPTGWVVPRAQWFDASRLEVAVAVLVFCALVLLSIGRARRGSGVSIRRIPGLEAVDEAVGRATEMGRPILYCPGLEEADQPGTIAAMGILGKVVQRAAASGTRTVVPNRDPVVMTVAREIGREACLAAGRPEMYREEDVYYATYSQFGYAAAVAGTMVRDRPAVHFFMGKFYGEALILAETGSTTGAMQIAGSDSDTQLPFFITTCDYTLIGEELYAASAYLSREPVLLGSLRGQDIAKLVLIALMGLGTLAAVFGFDVGGFLR